MARGGGGLLEPLPQPAQPARLLRGHAGHQAGGRHALRQAARHEDQPPPQLGQALLPGPAGGGHRGGDGGPRGRGAGLVHQEHRPHQVHGHGGARHPRPGRGRDRGAEAVLDREQHPRLQVRHQEVRGGEVQGELRPRHPRPADGRGGEDEEPAAAAELTLD